ncbi:hypothetical protein DXV76_15400 [Rhodobacteraceae bacterium CCMM004]|nr:hypothetical protein DXV76_15400 [Rhodobacteraceae bacterium CCMM004]
MKAGSTIAIAAVVAIAVAAGFYFIDIEQTQEARLPDVDVNVEAGELPEFDVQTGSISLTEEQVDVTVPEVEVTTTEKTLTVPSLNIEPAPEGDNRVAANQAD